MDVYIPYGAYWTTPFCKWQGAFSNLDPIPFAAEIVARGLKERGIAPEDVDGLCLGTTVPSRSSFYGAPWLAGLAGMPSLTGPTLSQACATGVRCIAYGAQQIAERGATLFLAVAADRTSNGPHMVYPDSRGQTRCENWVLDNFGHDPFARNSMIQTAENVAKRAGIDRRTQEETVLLRYRQYRDALAVRRSYMISPVGEVETDQGVYPTTAEGLAKRRRPPPTATPRSSSRAATARARCRATGASRSA